jgi:hypothetical protein
MEDVEPPLFVPVAYAACRKWTRSDGGICNEGFADHIKSFDVADILGVDSTIFMPSTGAPLN